MVNCPYCNSTCEQSWIACPKCGKSITSRSTNSATDINGIPKSPTVRIILAMFLAFAAIFAYAMTTTYGGSGGNQAGVSSQLPSNIGDIAVLSSIAPQILMGSTDDDFDKIMSAVSKKDDIGEQDMLNSGAAFLVPSGTHARWLGNGSFGVVDVRIVGGVHDGQEAFTNSENLHRLN